MVLKKDSSHHPVIDFCQVNALTVPDHYLIPVLSELLQSIGKHNTVFTSFDLSGSWQIPMDDKSWKIIAFSTPADHYGWLCLPMELWNVPLTFQMVNTLFSGIMGKGTLMTLSLSLKNCTVIFNSFFWSSRSLHKQVLKPSSLNVSSSSHASNSLDTLSMEIAFTQMIQKFLLHRSSLLPNLWRR